jgi:large subunit ribosomal protein L21
MYAVFKDGGHQIRAAAGERIEIDRRDVSPGDEIVFDQVLLVGGDAPKLGSPTVAGAKVIAVVDGQTSGPKLRGMLKRENNNSETRFGHRQKYTTVTVKEIQAS